MDDTLLRISAELRNDTQVDFTLKSMFTRFAAYCVGFLLALPVAHAAIMLIPRPEVSFAMACVVFVLSCIFVVGEAKGSVSELRRSLASRHRQGEVHTDDFIKVPFMLIFAFYTLSIAGFHLYGDQFIVADQPKLLDWVRYVFDELLGLIPFGISDVYGLEVSPIRHAFGFWSPTIVLVFRLALATAVFSLIWKGVILVYQEGDDAWRVDEGSITIAARVIDVWNLVTDTESIHELHVPRWHTAIERDTAREETEFSARSMFGGPSYPRYITEWHPPNVFGWGWDVWRTRIRFVVVPKDDQVELTYSRLSSRSILDRLLDRDSSEASMDEYVQKTLDEVKQRCEDIGIEQ